MVPSVWKQSSRFWQRFILYMSKYSSFFLHTAHCLHSFLSEYLGFRNSMPGKLTENTGEKQSCAMSSIKLPLCIIDQQFLQMQMRSCAAGFKFLIFVKRFLVHNNACTKSDVYDKTRWICSPNVECSLLAVCTTAFLCGTQHNCCKVVGKSSCEIASLPSKNER